MSRIFCIPGIILLFFAFVLNFLVSISLPSLPALDITRTHFNTNSNTGLMEVRLGIWAPCEYDTSGHRLCIHTGHGYEVVLRSQADTSSTQTVGASWTRGLAVHPVAAGVTLIAFALAFSTHITVTLVASLVSFLAALLTLIAFAIDIALFAFLKHQANKLQGVQAHTTTSAGFWMTFAALILLMLGGCTVCFGRRRDRMSGSTAYPMTSTSGYKQRNFWSRFRRN